MSLYLMSSQSREVISAAHLITDVTDKRGTSPSPPVFGFTGTVQLCCGGWWGWHCAMVRLSLPSGGGGPASGQGVPCLVPATPVALQELAGQTPCPREGWQGCRTRGGLKVREGC